MQQRISVIPLKPAPMPECYNDGLLPHEAP